MMGLRTHWVMSEEIMHLVGAASDVQEWRAQRMQGQGGQRLKPRDVAAAAAEAAKAQRTGPSEPKS
jgi:hypothetical protein